MRDERRQRGRGAGVPRPRDALHRDPRGDRAHARGARAGADPPLQRALRRRRRGARDRAGVRRRGARVSWFLAFAGFALLIILHEAGHFAAAKAVGMRVERFSLFFPPLLARKKIGETEYAIGAIPFGGYVKISGMNPSEDLPEEVRDRAYHAQPVWKRVVVIFAGPAVNLVLGFVLLVIYFSAIGPHEGNAIATVAKGFPAQGVLHPGDEIVAVNGNRGTPEQLGKIISADKCPQQPPVDRCKAAHPLRITV